MKRPPLPSVVHVAWYWDGAKWAVDWADEDLKTCRMSVNDGIFPHPHRHRYQEYRVVGKRAGKRKGRVA